MSQPSYGTSSNSSLSSGVKQQQQQHITQSQTRVQNIDMLSYNNGNNNANNGSITVVAESGGNTFAISNNASTLDQTTSISNQNISTGAIPKEKSAKNTKQQQPRKPPPTIDTFWPNILQEVQTAVVDSKHQSLPLARIKKIMKLDENAKMIAAEAPTLFAKACEFFIQELTMRAWIHTDESKRRTLQRSDIAQAIANYDQFDFLIDIVPREDIKPPNHRRHNNESASSANNSSSSSNNNAISSNNSPAPMPTATMTTVTGEILNVSGLPMETATATALPTTGSITGNINQTQPTQMITTATATTNQATPQLQIIQQATHPQQHLQYFITLPGQQTGQAQLVHQLQLQQQQQHLNNGLAAGTPLTAASLNLVAQQPQQLILTAANPATAQAANVMQHQQQTALLQNIAQHQQQQQQVQQQHHPQQVQLLQQVMLTPSGELTNMPIAINANQLNLLRLQMQQQQQHQQQQHHQQQVIIPTHLLTAQQLLQLQAQAQNQAQANTAAATTAHIVHHPAHITQQQQQQHQNQQQNQHHSQTTTPTNNIYINSNTVATNQATANAAAASMVSTDRNMGSTFRNNC
ncbi:nuclear transcription factor Y subunit gamma [Lucilia cuprina]|uniref:nuclear transcription factor Y subunit gamma n=1 Tax=Lucilia cuprina TaxID=7375 RepID=UPI001F066313|nr:nuclear transcription factor Y subunit gamma [Lucilia cuprina]